MNEGSLSAGAFSLGVSTFNVFSLSLSFPLSLLLSLALFCFFREKLWKPKDWIPRSTLDSTLLFGWPLELSFESSFLAGVVEGGIARERE